MSDLLNERLGQAEDAEWQRLLQSRREGTMASPEAPPPGAPMPPAAAGPPPVDVVPPGPFTKGFQVAGETIKGQGGYGLHRILQGAGKIAQPSRLYDPAAGVWDVLAGMVNLGMSPFAGGAAGGAAALKQAYPKLMEMTIATGAGAQGLRDGLGGALPVLGPQGLTLIRPGELFGETPGKAIQTVPSLGAYGKDTPPLKLGEVVESALLIAELYAVAKGVQKATGAGQPAPARQPVPARPAQPAQPSAPAPGPPAAAPTPAAPSAGKGPVPGLPEGDVQAVMQNLRDQLPVPPEAIDGPRIYGMNLERLGLTEAAQKAATAINKQLVESGRTAKEVTSRTHGDVKAAAAAQGPLSVEQALSLGVEDLTVQQHRLRQTAAAAINTVDDLHRRFVAGEPVGQELQGAIALSSELNARASLRGTMLGQALEAQKIRPDEVPLWSRSEAFQDLLEKAGQMPPDRLAGQLQAIKELHGQPAKTGFIQSLGSALRTARNVGSELFINNLLSGPKTHARNMLGNFMRYAIDIPDTALARLNKVLFFRKEPGGVQPGELQAKLSASAHLEAFTEGVRMAGAAAEKNAVTKGAKRLAGIPAGDATRYGQIVSTYEFDPALQFSETSKLGRGLQALYDTTRLPTALLDIEDAFGQGVNYRIEVKARARGHAYGVLGLRGEALTQEIAKLEHPSTMPGWLHEAAKDAAELRTFRRPLGPTGQAVTSALDHASEYVPGLRTTQMPFIRTPTNITKEAIQRTFGLNFPSIFWGELNQQLRAGGRARQMALAKIELSALTTGTVAYLASQGLITGGGPKNRQLREQMFAFHPPYSVKAGDQWISYKGISPWSDHLGFVADFAEIAGDLPEYQLMELGAAGVMAFARSTTSNPYFMGLQRIVDAMDQEPGARAQQLAKDLARSLRPAGPFMAQVVLDNEIKEVRSVLDAWRAGVPGNDLPPHRDRITAEPMRYPPGLGPDWASPISIREDNPDPVKMEIVAQRTRLNALPWTVGGKDVPFLRMDPAGPDEGVPLTPEQRDRWAVLAGQEVTIGGRTLYQALDHLRQSAIYLRSSDYPERGRAILLEATIHQYDRIGKILLFREYPELAQAIQERQKYRLQSRIEGRGTPPEPTTTRLQRELSEFIGIQGR